MSDEARRGCPLKGVGHTGFLFSAWIPKKDYVCPLKQMTWNGCILITSKSWAGKEHECIAIRPYE